jgi:hypothetical protein
LGVLDIFVIYWVDEEGVAGVEGSEIVKVAIDFLCGFVSGKSRKVM